MSKSDHKSGKSGKKDKKADKTASKPSNQASNQAKTAAKSNSHKTAAAAAAPFDPTISSLFANSLGPSKPDLPATTEDEDEDDDDEDEDDVDVDEDVDMDEDENDDDDDGEEPIDSDVAPKAAVKQDVPDLDNKRKRKRKDKHDDLENVYMERLAREEEKAAAKAKEERKNKRQKTDASDDSPAEQHDGSADEESDDDDIIISGADSDDEDAATPPPMHESLMPDTTSDLAKSQRTVFLGNVSTQAITSKSAQKTLKNHLSSFFSDLPTPEKDQPPYKLESLRFRSTAYASAIPKKAAYAKKELMEATTKSTNAYVVYSSPSLAREAARRLNATVVLDRHLRVDEVAHPAKVDHKRCVFVGNLGFVDDESNIDMANEEEGKGKRNGNKTPSDVEEGLWRSFGTCGAVESVRVIRDSKTRVGKGFAYVQFVDENAVEAALLLNEKKFPPMLPRKLRVSRAKAVKRNVKPGSNTARAPTHTKAKGIYNPKVSAQESSQMGRAGKLMGRAAAAQLRSGDGSAIRAPESFIFEGHRASSKQGKQGLKLGGAKKKSGKPTTRSSKRGAAWKSGGGKK